MSKYEKILHWLILLAFLGLCATALAAEYFFSKEAILDSFKKSLQFLLSIFGLYFVYAMLKALQTS